MQLTIVEVSLSRGVTFSEDVVAADPGGYETALQIPAVGSSPALVGGPGVTLAVDRWSGVGPSVEQVWQVYAPFRGVCAADGSSRAVPCQVGIVVE